jgi:hypothetical protein
MKALTTQGLDTCHCDPLYQLRRNLYDEGRCVSLSCILEPSTHVLFHEPGCTPASWFAFPRMGNEFGRRIRLMQLAKD